MRINPVTLAIEGARCVYIASEWFALEWPDCPACGTQVNVEKINLALNRYETRELSYVRGRWACPRGCRSGT